MAPGAYLVLPVLGPSSLRDGFSSLVDEAALSVNFGLTSLLRRNVTTSIAYNAVTLQPIVIRDRIEFRYYRTGSPFEHDLIHLLNSEKRKLDVAK